jgi:hypothetical protein
MDLVLAHDTVALRRGVGSHDASGAAYPPKVADLKGGRWRRAPHLDTEGGKGTGIAGVFHAARIAQSTPRVKKLYLEQLE